MLDLPLVEWIAHREIDAMAPDLAAHARLASLLGAEFTAAEVEGVVHALESEGGAGELRLDARACIRQLAAAGLLVTHGAELERSRVAGAGHARFRHALVRDAVARTVAPELGLRLHRAALAYYGADRDLPAETRLAKMAGHAVDAGLHDAARDAYLTLAERARERHAYVDAVGLYSSALAQPGAPSVFRRRACRGRGLMHYRLARYEDALLDLERARELARAEGDAPGVVEILLDEATVLDWMANFRASEARVEEARACATGIASPSIRARLLLGLGRSRHRFSREEEACELLTSAVAGAEELGDEGYETLVIALLMLGFILPGLGRIEEAERALERAIAESTGRGDRLHLIAALNNLGLAWAQRGDRARMVETFEQVLDLAREIGQPTMKSFVRFNLGEYLYLMGDAAGATLHIERAAEAKRRLQGDVARPIVPLLRARLRFHQGDVDGAGAIVRAIRSRQDEARRRGQSEMLMVPSEDVLCSAVELGAGDAGDAAWDELEERSARCSVGQERVEVIEFRGLAASRGGRHTEARRHLERALALSSSLHSVPLEQRVRRELGALPGG